MIDERDLFERSFRRYPPAEGSFERLTRRRDRRRRTQRVTAAVIGFAVFVAVIALFAVAIRSGTTPARPSPDGSAPPDLLPPLGSEPTSGGTGELVFEYRAGDAGGTQIWLYLYEDGRLLTNPGELNTRHDTRWVERRLTPEGVALLRAAVLDTGLFDRERNYRVLPYPGWAELEFANGVRVQWANKTFSSPPPRWITLPDTEGDLLRLLDERLRDPMAWLPDSAWAERESRRYVPPAYVVRMQRLPAFADAAWIAERATIGEVGFPDLGLIPVPGCAKVGLAEARVLAEALDAVETRFSWDAMIGIDHEPGISMVWGLLDASGRPVAIHIEMPLPHEEHVGCPPLFDR